MAPTAYGSAAILIDSTACRRTLVYSNIERRPFFPRRANPPWAVPHRRACCHTSRMPSVCSAAYRYAPVCFQQQAPSTPPRGGRTRPQATPRRAGPPPPVRRAGLQAARRVGGPARRRSQPARGRRLGRGTVRSRRNPPRRADRGRTKPEASYSLLKGTLCHQSPVPKSAKIQYLQASSWLT